MKMSVIVAKIGRAASVILAKYISIASSAKAEKYRKYLEESVERKPERNLSK